MQMNYFFFFHDEIYNNYNSIVDTEDVVKNINWSDHRRIDTAFNYLRDNGWLIISQTGSNNFEGVQIFRVSGLSRQGIEHVKDTKKLPIDFTPITYAEVPVEEHVKDTKKLPIDVFICYETTTGLSYAEHLKESLRRMEKSAFVAFKDLRAGELEQRKRDTILEDCKYFVVIITITAIQSKEVTREINLAGRYNKIIIPCKKKEVNRDWLSKLPIIGELQYIEFENKEELANNVISEIYKREMFPKTIESIPFGASNSRYGCKRMQ